MRIATNGGYYWKDKTRDRRTPQFEIAGRKLLMSGSVRQTNRIITVLILAAFSIHGHALSAQSIPPDAPEPQLIAPENSPKQIDELVRAKKWKGLATVTADLHRSDSNNSLVLYWLGTAHLQLHEPVPAVQAFRSAEKLNLNTALLHEGLGLAYYDLNQFELFEEQMKRAAVCDPRDSKPDYYLGFYRWTIRSDAEEALSHFENAIRLAPDDWKSIYQAGNSLEQLGRLSEARHRYEEAIALLDKNGALFGWPYQGLARLLVDENPSAALKLAEKAVNLEPKESSNHLVLAMVYEHLGNLQNAIREGQVAVDTNPHDSKTLYALYKLYRQAGDPRAKKQLEIFEQTKSLYDSN